MSPSVTPSPSSSSAAAPPSGAAIRIAVWGTGNMGSTAIRCALTTPGIELAGVITSSESKAGADAATFIGRDAAIGVAASTDVDAVLAQVDAVAYMASGDIRPDEAADDIERCLLAGCNVVTPSLYSMYDPVTASAELRERFEQACAKGAASLFVSGVDPGWANDAMAVLAAGLCTDIEEIRCQEIFDYSTYDQPYAVRELCGFGGAMDNPPMMLLEGVPTMVWGGNVRLIGRSLGLGELDITEIVERVPLDTDVETDMGRFEAGTQGAFRLQIVGSVDGRARVVIDHITRIDPACAPQWPLPGEGAGEHRIMVTGDPRLELTIRADVASGSRADGGNTTAVNRLLGAVPWLADHPSGVYDGVEIPLHPCPDPALNSQRWSV